MTKTDIQWAREIRDMLTYVGHEISWVEKHKELAPTIVPMCMVIMKDLALQYYMQKHAERRALAAKSSAKKAKAKREAAEKPRVRKAPRSGSNPVLAQRLAKRKARSNDKA